MRGYPSIKQINKFSQNQLFQIWIEIENSKCITKTQIPNVEALDGCDEVKLESLLVVNLSRVHLGGHTRPPSAH